MFDIHFHGSLLYIHFNLFITRFVITRWCSSKRQSKWQYPQLQSMQKLFKVCLKTITEKIFKNVLDIVRIFVRVNKFLSYMSSGPTDFCVDWTYALFDWKKKHGWKISGSFLISGCVTYRQNNTPFQDQKIQISRFLYFRNFTHGKKSYLQLCSICFIYVYISEKAIKNTLFPISMHYGALVTYHDQFTRFLYSSQIWFSLNR